MVSNIRLLLAFVVWLILFFCSCSVQKRLHMRGYYIEGRATNSELQRTEDEGIARMAEVASNVNRDELLVLNSGDNRLSDLKIQWNAPESPVLASSKHQASLSNHQPFANFYVPSNLSPDTLKKPFKPQQQYREVDPVGKASVIVVLAGVALQKIVDLLAWFEVIVPLSFGPGIFIPALIIAFIGLGLSIYSAYRVRKYPEKYKKNEWGKAALAILGWQILMTVLFAWLLV